MTLEDLAAYAAKRRVPVRSFYRGYEVFGMGPPSSGGSTVAEALNILDGYALDATNTALTTHRYLEASKLAFADRGAYVGDPDFVKVPLTGLLDSRFAAERRSLISDTALAAPVAPGNPWYWEPGSQKRRAAVTASSAEEGPSTTNLTVSDRFGNVVEYTFTIEQTGGAGIVVPNRGFLLNNELTDFDFALGKPNSPKGGKRPRSSISPTLVLKKGEPVLALGSPGGSTIITTVLQILVNRIDLVRSLPDAIAAPRASQRNTASVTAEPGFISSPLGQALAGEPYRHKFADGGEIGAATAIEFLGSGQVLAAAEPTRRGGGSALAERRPGK
jgi:gamma-glutamyltranspeptidase/glutathione hydrolase